MAGKPGKFTQQFDSEILKKIMDTPDDTLAKEIQEKLAYIEETMEKRKTFLLTRFENSSAEETEKGVTVSFKKNEKYPKDATLEFRFAINEDTRAIQLDYSIELEGESTKKDYIILALKKFDPKKIDHFIESKILQFARVYIQEGEE